MDIPTLRQLGKTKFGAACRMCKECNGVACAGEIPGMGGVATGQSFQNNLLALKKTQLRQRIIHAAGVVDPSFDFLGFKLSAPIIAAPIGGIEYNLNNFTPEQEYALSIVLGSQQAGGIGMTGDGPLEIIYKSGLAAIQAAAGRGIPTIKPRANKDIIQQAEAAKKINAPAIAIDVDSAALINMTRLNQPVGPKTPKELAELVREIKLPLIIKGVMTVDDAIACLEAGIAGIVVSNHGGRVLDHTPGTAEVLPDIARAVKKRMLVLADGGVRTGTDVLKMLALGADAVLVGRPFMQAVVGGVEGVACLLEKMIADLKAAMIMTGAADLAAVNESLLYKHT
jgi:isopentenyl diphosphate isomerase/L-lactate dehydrogenase-like FMN-dependent dehydrogenase